MSKKTKVQDKKTVQISLRVHEALRDHCNKTGVKLNWFVDKTLSDKIKPV